MASATAVEKVGNFAFYSRILVLLMQCFFNFLIPDHEAGVFQPPSNLPRRLGDRLVSFFLEGCERWDGIYFMHVGQHGYTYENTLAFFPLFPLTARVLANTILFPLQFIMNYASVLLVAATIMNFVLFVKSAQLLYLLGQKVLKNDTLALKAAQLYCINPASIFFTAAYSETIFAFLTFAGLLQLENGSCKLAAIVFNASGLTRSNGIINSGFIIFTKLKELYFTITQHDTDEDSDNRSVSSHVISTIISCICYVLLGSASFIFFQVYSYLQYCTKGGAAMTIKPHIRRYGQERDYTMPSLNYSPWCHDVVPVAYSYVQNNHWNVGFLKYYEFKQWPNFLLASPMALICIGAAATYGFQHLKVYIRRQQAEGLRKKFDDAEIVIPDISEGFTSNACLPYVLHMSFLVTFAAFFMHIQVMTRFIASSCPVIYWYVATLTTTKDQLNSRAAAPNQPHHQHHPHINHHMHSNGDISTDDTPQLPEISDEVMDWDSRSRINKIIFVYFHLYFFVGIGAFANFLPWT